MSSTVVYFAEPIDFDRANLEEDKFRWRLIGQLEAAGYLVYRPADAWKSPADLLNNDRQSRVIESINRQALRRADVVIARLPAGVASHGVPAEIEAATNQFGVPVVVIGPIGVAFKANPMVSSLAEDQTDKLIPHVEVVLATGRIDGNTIRYSGPSNLKQAHYGDAGIDLPASEKVGIPGGGDAFIHTGLHISIPSGCFGWVVARSSTYSNHRLMVLPGVIDEGFTGPIGIKVVNVSSEWTTIEPGDRVAQMLILGNMLNGFDLQRLDSVDEVHPRFTSRGSNGFGSSGR